MDFTFDEYLESGLSADAYMLLYYLVHEKEMMSNNKVYLGSSYVELQNKGYIKIQDKDIIYRQKILDLRKMLNPEPQFEEFWRGYHEYAKQFNPSFRATDKAAGEKYWKKLNKSEKNLAFDNYKKFIDSTCTTMSARYIKKAYTFLRDKNFNDEFEIIETKSSLNKMI